MFDLLSCRNVCATEYAEVCEERVATRLGEFLAFSALNYSSDVSIFTHLQLVLLKKSFHLLLPPEDSVYNRSETKNIAGLRLSAASMS